MDFLGNDLLKEIFIRVSDCRQVSRCASVCKRWSSLIGNADFVRSFTSRRHNLDDADIPAGTVALLLQRSDCFTNFGKEFCNVIGEARAYGDRDCLSFLPFDNAVIRAYCDDLLLVSRPNNECGQFSFCICNPTTKEYRCDIPEPPQPPGSGHTSFITFVKCALTRRDNQGRHSYHVTLFFLTTHSSYNGQRLSVTDFSLEIGRWSSPVPIQERPCIDTEFLIGFHFSLLSDSLVSCNNGLVYWKVWDGIFQCCQWVAVFDPLSPTLPDGRKYYRLIPQPIEAGIHERISVCLGAYRGRLRASYITEDMVLRVWELIWSSERRDDGPSCHWSMVHKSTLEMTTECQPLALHPEDGNVIFLQIGNRTVVRYDMSRQTSQTAGRLPVMIPGFDFLGAYPLCSAWPTPVPSADTCKPAPLL